MVEAPYLLLRSSHDMVEDFRHFSRLKIALLWMTMFVMALCLLMARTLVVAILHICMDCSMRACSPPGPGVSSHLSYP